MRLTRNLCWPLLFLLTLPVEANQQRSVSAADLDRVLSEIRALTYDDRPAEARRKIDETRKRPGLSESFLTHLDVLEAEVFVAEGKLTEADFKLQDITLPLGTRDDLEADFFAIGALVAFELGEFRRAESAWMRAATLDRRKGRRSQEIGARFNATAARFMEQPDEELRQRAIDEFTELLEGAQHARLRLVPKVRLELGKLLNGAKGRAHLDRCLELTTIPEALSDRISCLGALAVALLDEDPGLARRQMGEAVALAEADYAEMQDPWPLLGLTFDRLIVTWTRRPKDQAFRDSMDILRWIERLREQQADVAIRAGFFSVWSDAYHWLAGRLLYDEAGEPPSEPEECPLRLPVSRDDLERAFAINERYRARSLFDAREPASAARPVYPPGTAARPTDSPRTSTLNDQRFAGLGDITKLLAEDEALLAFQVAPWKDLYGRFAGGSWLIAVTRQGSRVYCLRKRVELERKIDLFLGLLSRRDEAGLEPQYDELGGAAASLYSILLAPALSDLPEAVSRLILVPDGALHQLPFGMLRATPEDAPLAARYQISRVPSATLWRGWRRSSSTVEIADALIVANPYLAPDDVTGPMAKVRARLGPLPGAEIEAGVVYNRMGRDSELLIGKAASESTLKSRRLADYGLLHFAAHAVVDHVHPELSAIQLAATGTDDGALRVAEIVDLPLDGQVVVLSTCQSADGGLLRGEGIMSLARGFFQAGASTVVATLRKLGDREAQRLFGEFYRYLSDGRTVQESLQLTQAARRKQGAPEAVWASVVVMGDGNAIPIPRARRLPLAIGVIMATLTLTVLILTVLAVSRRSHDFKTTRNS